MNTDARDRFPVNSRVVQSADGRRVLWTRDPDAIGTVVGHSRCRRYVRVVIDGQRTAGTYAPEFWRVVPKAAP